jgi:hypothetical protein
MGDFRLDARNVASKRRRQAVGDVAEQMALLRAGLRK